VTFTLSQKGHKPQKWPHTGITAVKVENAAYNKDAVTTQTLWLFDRRAVYSQMSGKKSCVQSTDSRSSGMAVKTLLSVDTSSDRILKWCAHSRFSTWIPKNQPDRFFHITIPFINTCISHNAKSTKTFGLTRSVRSSSSVHSS